MPTAMLPIAVLVAGTAGSAPALIDTLVCAASSTADPGTLVIAHTDAPFARAALAERTRSSLPPDCEIIMTPAFCMRNPPLSEKTDVRYFPYQPHVANTGKNCAKPG